MWQFTLTEQVAGTPRALLGEMYAHQTLTAPSASAAAGDEAESRYLFKVGMRERYGQSF
nr:hypothetical protein [Candidatus Symbiopectobacterium sp. 'North America']